MGTTTPETSLRRRKGPNDQRVTLYLSEGAVGGRVEHFLETGLLAWMESEVPRHERVRFTLHLPGEVIAGECQCLAQEDRSCRLQFTALTDQDRERLAPFVEADA
jgi:hypothetical protein